MAPPRAIALTLLFLLIGPLVAVLSGDLTDRPSEPEPFAPAFAEGRAIATEATPVGSDRCVFPRISRLTDALRTWCARLAQIASGILDVLQRHLVALADDPRRPSRSLAPVDAFRPFLGSGQAGEGTAEERPPLVRLIHHVPG